MIKLYKLEVTFNLIPSCDINYQLCENNSAKIFHLYLVHFFPICISLNMRYYVKSVFLFISFFIHFCASQTGFQQNNDKRGK